LSQLVAECGDYNKKLEILREAAARHRRASKKMGAHGLHILTGAGHRTGR
jgi:hypothetical protein